MKPLRILDLFSGIGGFSLGLERTGGFKTVAFCEFDKKAQLVLAKHWPGVPIYDDVRTLTGERLATDGLAVDCIVGGFPCQDISIAGTGAGLAGERSGLWADYARIIGEVRPRYVIVENVSALLGRGFGDVLGDLAALGYDAEWHCIPASHVGAPHRRDRLWIVAYPTFVQRNGSNDNSGECVGYQQVSEPRDGRGSVALANPRVRRHWLSPQQVSARRNGTLNGDWWGAEPNVGRVADGVPHRVDRLKQLGNAVVPQVVELIGRAILAAEAA